MAKIKSGFRGERAIILPASVVEEYRTDPLGRLLYITDIGFYPKAGFHYRSRRKEEAAQFVFIHCTEGSGWFEVDGLRRKVGASQCFILPKGKAHAYGTERSDPWSIYWIHFDGESAAFFAEDMDRPTGIAPGSNSRIGDRLHLFEEIFSTLRNGYRKDHLQYGSTALFHFLGSLKFLTPYRESAVAEAGERDFTSEAIHFMRENLGRKLSLKEMADYTGYSPSHFSALFREKTGYPPLQYLLQLKIQEACHHLDFSDLKINQISVMTGFPDALYFSRIFTKVMGTSPSEYRSRKKG